MSTDLLARFERRHGAPPFANVQSGPAGAEDEGGSEAY